MKVSAQVYTNSYSNPSTTSEADSSIPLGAMQSFTSLVQHFDIPFFISYTPCSPLNYGGFLCYVMCILTVMVPAKWQDTQITLSEHISGWNEARLIFIPKKAHGCSCALIMTVEVDHRSQFIRPCLHDMPDFLTCCLRMINDPSESLTYDRLLYMMHVTSFCSLRESQRKVNQVVQ